MTLSLLPLLFCGNCSDGDGDGGGDGGGGDGAGDWHCPLKCYIRFRIE